MTKFNNGCFDIPDDRDYSAEQIFGAATGANLPESINLAEKVEMNSQDQESTYACTAFGLTNVHEILNRLEHGIQIDFDAWEQWKNQLDNGTARRGVGDSLQDALKQLKASGLTYNGGNYPIEGYASVNRDEFKRYLSKGYPLYTGCGGYANWAGAKKTGILTFDRDKKSYGHCFCIVGYEPGYYICMNSYGNDWGVSNGLFKIKEDQAYHLFTAYIVYDKVDVDYIFTDVTTKSVFAESIKWAKDNKIVKGYEDGSFRPNQPITRAEMIQTLYNMNNAGI